MSRDDPRDEVVDAEAKPEGVGDEDAGVGDENPAPPLLGSLQAEQGDAAPDETAQLRELAQRVQADFENYRKRVLREQTALVERANEGLIQQLLPVLDSFELALSSIDADEKVRKGVELVYAEFLGALEKAGVERIDALGKPFDPNEHEAVAQEDGPGEPVVCDVLRGGYRLKGRVLRPATVRVTRAAPGA